MYAGIKSGKIKAICRCKKKEEGSKAAVEIRELLREGKSKQVYATDDPDLAVVYFKDEAMAFHGLKRGRIVGKGEVNNAVCQKLFTMLARHGVKVDYVAPLDARGCIVKRTDMLPIEVKVRNRVAGSLSRRLGLPIGTALHVPVVEFLLKNEAQDNPLINISHICAMQMATAEEMDGITKAALQINEILSQYMRKIGVELIDFQLEFGRFHGEMLLADDISPDSARFWDAKTHEPLDIDRFRRDLGNAEQAYQELWRRMMEAGDV